MKVNGDLKFRTLGSGELQNAIIERVNGGVAGGSLPTGAEGRIVFNLDSNTYWFYGGSAWNEFGGGGDISNVINSGGYMNGDGTFDPTAFSGFTNVSLGSPTNGNLVEVLADLDAAISTAAGVDTLEELTDTTISSPTAGQLLYYKDGTDEWTQTDVTGLSDGDVLTWDNGAGTWTPTESTNVLELPDLTDVDNATTSGASDGEVLRFNSGAAAGSEWNSEGLDYIIASDGNTFVTTTSVSAGAPNPRVSADAISFYVDVSSTPTLVGQFSSTELDLTAPDNADIDINAGAGVGGAAGGITLDAGSTGAGYASGAITLTAGSQTGGSGYAGGQVRLVGGNTNGNQKGGNVKLDAGDSTGTGGSAYGGDIDINAGDGYNTGGAVLITAGDSTDAYNGGDVQLQAGDGGSVGPGGDGGDVIVIGGAGDYSNTSGGDVVLRGGTPGSGGSHGVVRVQAESSSATGELRIYDNDNSHYIGHDVPASITSSITYTWAEAPASNNYLLQSQTDGTLAWVDPSSIGGNSFDTWAGAGNTSGDASIIATTTSDTATLSGGDGINVDLNAPADTIELSYIATGLSDTTIAGIDYITFFDGGPGGSLARTSIDDLFEALEVPNGISGNGFVVKTDGSPLTWTSRSIVASTTASEEGIIVNNGDGIAGNPEVGLDIDSLTAEAGTPSSTDTLPMYDGTNNVKVSISQLNAGITAVGIALDDLSDVDATGPSTGDILVYGLGSPLEWEIGQPGQSTGVQPYDVGLASIAGLALTTNDFLYVSAGSPETFATLASGTTGRALLGDETVADAITTLGLDSGGVSDIWVDVAGDTMTGDLVMSEGGAGSPTNDARVLLSDGSATRPSLAFGSDASDDTGFWRSAENTLKMVTGGADRVTLDSSGNTIIETGQLQVQDGTGAAPSITFESDTNSGAFLIESDLLGLSAGGAERLRIYGKDFDLITGSPNVEAATGAISVENTANYEDLIGDPAGSGFITPVDDFLPNAQWVDLYYLKKSGGTMTGDLIFSSADINMGGNSIINLAAPTSALDATNKNYVDNLVSSGTVWVNPVRNPDLVGISADEVLNPLSSGAYIAYGGTYPQFWATDAGSPATGSPQFIEVNEYDVMHYTFGAWEKSTNLLTGFSNPRFGAGIFTNALDTTPGQSLDGTGIQENDLVEYIGSGSPNNPLDPDNWQFPHGRVGGVTFDVISVTASTKTFVIDGDRTRSLFEGNTFLYSGSGSPGGTGSPQDLAATYTIDSVTLSGSPETTVVTVDETVAGDGTGGYIEPEIRDGITTLTSNEDDSHFGQSYLYVADNNEWVQISGPGNVDAGVGLSYQGNTLNVNLGAGIVELPGDEVGIELYNAASGALILTDDGSTRATTDSSRLHLLLSAAGGLDQGTAGLFIKSGGVTNDMLENGAGINISGDAGTPTDVPLGGSVAFNGTDGVVVTVGAGGGSPSALDVTVDLDSVPNSALAFSSIGLADGVSAVDEVSLGEDIDVSDGGIASGSNSLKFRRIEDADGDTYVETSTAVGDDGDTVTIEAAGAANGTFDSSGVSLSGAAIDIDATGGTVAIDATAAASLTGGVDANLVATTGDALVHAVAGSVELQATTAVEVLDNIDLRLYDADNSHYIGHKSAAVVSTSITYEWPEAPAGSGYVLTSTTGGVMSWVSPDTVGRTRLEDLDDVSITTGAGSPNVYTEGDMLVASGASPNVFENQQIQYIYDSTLSGSPSASTSHIINHNLGQKYVNVTVYNSSDNQIIPQSVVLNSSTQLTVTLNQALDITVVIMGVPGVVAKDGS